MTSLSSAAAVTGDRDLVHFCRSIIEAARREYGSGLVTEPGLACNPRLLYTETHYALAALLLALLDDGREILLDLAESRLRLWNEGPVPLTFFNSMAVCLAAINFKRSGREHAGVNSILEELLANTPRRHRDVAYKQYCGNNAYLQQVAVDTLLLPLALGESVAAEELNYLVTEFRKFRTPEGLFFDLPRHGTVQERLMPPTYILKILFLAGMCHQLCGADELADIFLSGMTTLLPLLSREGSCSYFGRTDNSPFAAGLTIFNLRKAAQLCPGKMRDFLSACSSTERYYQSFPKTSTGLLQCNRFTDARSLSELAYSRDDYAYVGQYSLASCAYALLGCYCLPLAGDLGPQPGNGIGRNRTATSRDLGVVKLASDSTELILRTGSQITAWDRRYLGPTILRYQVDDQLLIGAIPRTVSSDERAAQKAPPETRLRRGTTFLRRRFRKGFEQLDGISPGFLPVVRQGRFDYLPYKLLALEVSPSHLKSHYQMVQLCARGIHPCMIELGELLHRNLPPLKPKYYSQPSMKPVDSLQLRREIRLEPEGLWLEDRISGDLTQKTILFSVRYFLLASIEVRGLAKLESLTCWGSNGRQTLDIYEAEGVGSEIRYQCELRPNLVASSAQRTLRVERRVLQ